MAGRHSIVHFCPPAKLEALRQGDTPASLKALIIISNGFCLSHIIRGRFPPKGTGFLHFHLLSPSLAAYGCQWGTCADTLRPCVCVFVKNMSQKERERESDGQGVIYTLYFDLWTNYRTCYTSHVEFSLTRQLQNIL